MRGPRAKRPYRQTRTASRTVVLPAPLWPPTRTSGLDCPGLVRGARSKTCSPRYSPKFLRASCLMRIRVLVDLVGLRVGPPADGIEHFFGGPPVLAKYAIDTLMHGCSPTETLEVAFEVDEFSQKAWLDTMLAA